MPRFTDYFTSRTNVTSLADTDTAMFHRASDGAIVEIAKSDLATAVAGAPAAGAMVYDVTPSDDLQAVVDAINPDRLVGVPAATIRMAPGEYVLTATLEILRANVYFIGEGVGNKSDNTQPGFGTTIVWNGAADTPIVRVRDVNGGGFKNIRFAGHTNGTTSASCGIRLHNDGTTGTVGTNEQFVVEDCWFGYWPFETGNGGLMDHCIEVDGTNGNNDQFRFIRCRFDRPVTSAVRIANSQSVWGSIEDCLFNCNLTAIGLETAANIVLRNCQFNRCTSDISISGTAQVYEYGHQSENCGKVVDCASTSAGYVCYGGFILLSHKGASPGPIYNFTDFGGRAQISLNDIVLSGFAGGGTPPELYVRGNTSTALSSIYVNNCILSEDAYNVVAGSGTGGIMIDVRDRATFGRALLANSQTLTFPLNGPKVQSTAAFTLNYNWAFKTIRCTNASQHTVTIPTNASVALPIGTWAEFFAEGAGGVTLSTSGITLAGSSPNTTIAQNGRMRVQKADTDTWIVTGGTAA